MGLSGLEYIQHLQYSNPELYVETLYQMQKVQSGADVQQAIQVIEGLKAQQQTTMFYGHTASGQAYIEFIPNTVSNGIPASVSSSTETALELAQSSELTATGSEVLPTAQGVLKPSGSSGYQTASLLSMDVGMVGAAVAPLLGVSLGVNLYQKSPDFWTKLSTKLLPFCYEGTTEIPTWLDIVESAISPGTYETNVLIDKSIYNAIKDFFDEEGIIQTDVGDHDDSVTVDGITIPGPISRLDIPAGQEKVIGLSIYGGVATLASQNNVRLYVTYDVDQQDLVIVAGSSGFAELRCYDETGVSRSFTLIPLTTSKTYDNRTVYYYTLGSLDKVPSLSVPVSYSGAPVSFARSAAFAWYLRYGEYTTHMNLPEGASTWQGQAGSTSDYPKSIIYYKEDPDNPGTFILDEAPAIPISITDKPAQETRLVPTEKPEYWPEGVDWPITIAFPWPSPAGYEGDWPATMPWPLPETRPDWWPKILPYPSYFPISVPSNDPSIEPNPNESTDPRKIPSLVEKSIPGATVLPEDQPTPDPVTNPSSGGLPILPIFTPTIPEDPVSNGENPPPVTPSVPVPFTSVNDGLISVYHPTDAQLKAFAQWLWVTYADPSIDKLWNNPFDGVIGLMELYCTPTDIGVKTIRSGFLDSGVSSQTISRYTEINCGTITVPEYYGNYYDYSPYSKCHVYLPFIGIVELNVDDIVGHAVNITYKIDEYNGSCIAMITVAKSTVVNGERVDYSEVIYQFSGNCAVELPLAGGSQAAIRAGLIQAAAYGLSSVIGGVVSGVSGNIGGAVSQLGYGAANAIGSVVSAKSSVQHSGSFGASFGALGIKIPFIVISRPKQVIVPDYNKVYGYPAHKFVTVGACTGYLRVREVHVTSSTASDEEKKLIEELLKEGVYVTEE